MSTTVPAFRPKEIQTRFLYPFFFERGKAAEASDSLSRETIIGRDGKTIGVWECSPPPALYKEELLDHVDKFLFHQTGRGCRYLRISNAVSSRWFNRLQVVLAEPKPAKEKESNGIASEPGEDVPTPIVWPVSLAPLASIEIFLTNYGVGVFSISLIPNPPELDFQNATLFNYKLAQLRPQVAARLRIPHASENTKQWEQMPALQKAKIAPAPSIDAPISQRLGCAGGAFLLSELVSEMVLNPLQGLRIQPLQKQFSVYTVVRFGDEVDFEQVEIVRALSAFLSGLAQVEEPSHAGSLTGIISATNAILNRRHSAAVGLLGMAHIVSNQPTPELSFNEQRVPRVSLKYFVPYLAALLQRASLHRSIGDASDLVLSQKQDMVGELRKLRKHLLEFAVEGYFPEISHREVIDRYYRMAQEGLGVRRAYEDVKLAISDIDAQFSADHQAEQRELMANNADAARLLQEQMNQNLQAMVNVQNMVGWIEVFFVSVYLAELWHLFATHVDVLHKWLPHGVIASAIVGALAAAAVLKPWKHGSKPTGHS